MSVRQLSFVLLSLVLALAACGPARRALIGAAVTAPGGEIGFAAQAPVPGPNLPRAARPSIVALSGGGPDGAFGAGYLVGRMGAGRQAAPEVMTGVSIGALVATLAFAGEKQKLEQIFSGGALARVGEAPDPLRGLLLGSLASSRPYVALLEAAVDEATLARVAAEHRRGRRLYVATTDIDRMSPVVWDMGAIASQPGPGALAFFRRVLLASASIPGVYPPVALDDAAGQRRVHVDGGASAQFYVPEFPPGRGPGDLLIIIDNTLGSVPPLDRYALLDTVQRGVSSLIRAQSRNLIEIERLEAARRGYRVSVVALPSDSTTGKLEDFSAEAMAQKFELGRSMAAQGGA